MPVTICHNFKDSVAEEVKRARSKHRDIHSRHEAVAVIQEEFEEFKESVFRDKDTNFVLAELIQLAAMCQRAAEDVKELQL